MTTKPSNAPELPHLPEPWGGYDGDDRVCEVMPVDGLFTADQIHAYAIAFRDADRAVTEEMEWAAARALAARDTGTEEPQMTPESWLQYRLDARAALTAALEAREVGGG